MRFCGLVCCILTIEIVLVWAAISEHWNMIALAAVLFEQQRRRLCSAV
jgi:hypothetical protein